MSGGAFLPMGGFYQFGYVTRDLDAAIETLRTQFGIEHYRRKRNAPWMEAVHAWTGDTQIEVLQLGEGAPEMYFDYIPEQPGKLRLHHLGRRLGSIEEWKALERVIDDTKLDTPLRADAMDGHLRAIYVDTRDLLGIYSEYVFFSGPALNIYDDVPRN